LVYDALYPYTVGGAERWMRGLAERMVRAGHDVTYLTRHQWDDHPDVHGFRVVAVSRPDPLYGADGNRRISPPVRFGLGVFRYLVRHRREFDVVHACSFPYFSIPAIRLALAGTGTRVGVDWFEVWTSDYWHMYSGRAAGTIGWLIQRLCVRLTRHAFVFSDLHARRLTEEGFRGRVVRLSGLFARRPDQHFGDVSAPRVPPVVLFAGRHITEKRPTVVVDAIEHARASIPDLRGLIIGDGPERPAVLKRIADARLEDVIDAPGFVDRDAVERALSSAACLLLPSSREGYGLVIVEAASFGTPSVVAAGPDNAAVELIEEGANGFVSPSESATDLAAAIERVIDGGAELRARASDWFNRRAGTLDIATSTDRVLDSYQERSAR
jgi:glycosyltransferase involved in cell wall biosynthesis